MNMARAIAAVGLALATFAPAGQALRVRGLDGQMHEPLRVAPGSTHLLFFVATDCPISNRYAPEIGRIVAEYAPRHVSSFLIYADSRATEAHVRAHVAEFWPTGIGARIILDEALAVTRGAGATVTPEAAVYTPAGRVYRGRIDDLYIKLGETRRAPTRRDLRVSLDAVVAGLRVPVAETQAVGCYIQQTK